MNSLYGKLKAVMATSCLNLVLRRVHWYKIFSRCEFSLTKTEQYPCSVKMPVRLQNWLQLDICVDIIGRQSKLLLENLG